MLQTNLITVKADDDQEATAFLAECTCGGRQFIAFQITNAKHFHLQCTSCGEAYCPGFGKSCAHDGHQAHPSNAEPDAEA